MAGFCNACGAAMGDGVRFCPSCGKPSSTEAVSGSDREPYVYRPHSSFPSPSIGAVR